MKTVFVKTTNVKNFISAMGRLQKRQEDIPGMALIYSEPGLGKTRTVLWWLANNNAIYVRAQQSMSARWLLEDLVKELEEVPEKRVSDLSGQIREILAYKPRTIVVDEVDYLLRDGTVEILRDIHDLTGVPIVLVGMNKADQKLKRFRHLYDRLSEIYKFDELSIEDVRTIVAEKCEVKFSDGAINYIYNAAKRFRPVVRMLYKAEAIAKTSNLREITATHLNGGKA